MDALNEAIYLIISAFHIYIFYLALRTLLGDPRVSQYVIIASYSIFFVFKLVLQFFGTTPALNLATSIGSLCIISNLYNGKTHIKILISCFLYLAAMLIESFVYNAISFFAIESMQDNPTVGHFTSNIIAFTFIQLYSRIKQSKPSYIVNRCQWLAILVLPIGSLVIVVFAYAEQLSACAHLVIVGILIATNILVFYLYGQLGEYYLALYQIKLLQQQNLAYVHEFELINSADENLKILRHDIKNHLYMLLEFVNKHNVKMLEQYIQSLIGELLNIKSRVESGNHIIDSIINYKLMNFDAQANVDIRIPSALDFSPQDLNIILCNLLDNAMEALNGCSIKYINVHIEMEKRVLYIHVSNPFDGTINKVNMRGATTYITGKDDISIHGLGLLSVRRIVEKYDGVINICDKDHIFNVDIILYSRVSVQPTET